MQETATEILTKVKNLTNSFDQAKHFLIEKRMVVITGVQGSGKTFLAKSLLNDLENEGHVSDSFSISNLKDLIWGPSEKIDLYIIDDIFYELQLYEKFEETLKSLNEFLNNAGETYVIITIPLYTWTCHGYAFDTKFDKVLVNLDKRKESEKLTILESLQEKYHLSREELEGLDELQSDLTVTSLSNIGFPSLVSWIYKHQSEFEKYLCYPLETMRDEISSIKNATTVEERGTFLVLSYMCLKDGKMDVKNVDKILFDSLKKMYAPEFKDEDLDNYCEGMVGYYLLNGNDSCYEFDLNIMKKIVFVSLAKDRIRLVREHCKNDYFKYVINREDPCPRDVETWYTECFTII